jgi:cellulose synthase/poly-beta-1,6-N-acetylglucosamine synthase-like glycosyltransferase/transposase
MNKPVQKSKTSSIEFRRYAVLQKLDKNRKITDISKEIKVSRQTIYNWIKRYKHAHKDRKSKALESKYVRGKDHPKAKYPFIEKNLLGLIAKKPHLSIRDLAQQIPTSTHTIWNVLNKHGLNKYNNRLAYAQDLVGRQLVKAPIPFIDKVRLVLEQFIPNLAPAPPPEKSYIKLFSLLKIFLISLITTSLTFSAVLFWVTQLNNAGLEISAGIMFSSIALLMGSVFLLYSLRYYITLAVVLSFSQQTSYSRDIKEEGRGLLSRIFGFASGNGKNGNGKKGAKGPVGLEPNLQHIVLKRYPYISIHVPFYNEKNVAKRLIAATTNFDYKGEYEVIIADDSTDKTVNIVREYQKQFLVKGEKLKEVQGDGWTLTQVTVKPGVTLKHLHRTTRSGFKGGALKEALKQTNPRTEFVSVFDADFVPYPDTLQLFLKYFKVQNNMDESYKKSNLAVVQGYQWHVLNKSENWITRGVRCEYAGSYVIERPGREILGALKQISGSVYMIRKDVLEKLGWGTSITEDFQLTLRLYEAGYKVVFTPYIQAPAECVSTIKRLVRQRMRWAEGHSNNVKKMFFKLVFNKNLNFSEKVELFYLTPYYLQAFFFLVGTICWLLSETLFKGSLPFWTSVWGWSLVLTNFISLPLMNSVGLFLEESEEKDYLGILSFITLSYILVPFQAYASLKGFIKRKEGPWFRTPKTGRITDVFTRGRFYRFIAGIFPRRRTIPIASSMASFSNIPTHLNKYLSLSTANNQFKSFKIKPKRLKWTSKVVLTILLILTVTVYSATKGVPEVEATQYTNPFYLYDEASSVLTGTTAEWRMVNGTADTSSSASTIASVNNKDTAPLWMQYTPGNTNLTEESATSCASNTPDNAGWIFETVFESGGQIASGTWTFYVDETDNRSGNVGTIQVCVWRVTVSGGTINTSNLLFGYNDSTDVWDGADSSFSFTTGSQSSYNIGPNEYLYVEYFSNLSSIDASGPSTEYTSTFRTGPTYNNPYIDAPTATIPEMVIVFISFSPFIPMIVFWIKRRSNNSSF